MINQESNRYTVRIEWGGLTSYVDPGMLPCNWDGGVSIEKGNLCSIFLIETKDYGHFVFTERWIPLSGTVWRSRTNQSLAGVVLEIEGEADTFVHIQTTQKAISFRIGELVVKRYLRWPIGAKYSGITLTATFQGEGPFAVDAPVAPGCLDIRLPYNAFTGADHYGLFNNALAAWIFPKNAVEAELNLSRPPIRESARRSAFTLELRIALADSLQQHYVKSSHVSPFDMEINGQPVNFPPVYFRTESKIWRGTQWIEFVTVEVPAAILRQGANRMAIRNTADRDLLIVISAQLRERMEEDLHWEAVPSWARSHESFDLLFRCLRPHRGLHITAEGARPARDLPTELPAGLHRLTFIAGAGPKSAVITLAGGQNPAAVIPVFSLPVETPSWKVGGCMQNVKLDQSDEMNFVIDTMRDTQMGNYLLFRMDPGAPDRCHPEAAMPEDWAQWARRLRERRIYFSMVGGQGWKNVKCEPIGPYPEMLEACRILKEHGGDYFFSTHFHEYSRWVCSMSPGQFEELHGPEFSLKDARDLYVRSVAGIEGIKGVKRQCGQALPLMHYDYAGGIDYIAVETMALNTSHLFAAIRGAARAWNKKTWGIHNAAYWVKAPEDFTKLSLNYLNFYMIYLAGGNFAYSEDGHINVPHAGTQYGFHSEEPARLRDILRQFYRYVNLHPRQGELRVNLAVALGNLSCEIVSFPLHFLGHKTNVWGNKGGNDPKWQYGDPERGLVLLDELMPYWQDGHHIRHWFTGTPYGQFDVTPVEKVEAAVLNQYKTLIFLGWNTMTPEIYAKLQRFVEQGGTLLMAVPHLTMHEDRAFLSNMDNLNLIHGGDWRDLFGVRIQGRGIGIKGGAIFSWSVTTGHATTGFPQGQKYRILMGGFNLAAVENVSARIVICDEPTGCPVLIENRMGAGKACLLTTWAYPGKPGLEPLVRDILAALAQASQGEIKLEDHSREVAYSVWKDKTGLVNVYLLNTDWTEEGNIKSCRLHLGRHVVPLAVREQRLMTVVWQDDLVVWSDDPAIYVEDIRKTAPGNYRLLVHGDGHSSLKLNAESAITGVTADGIDVPVRQDHDTQTAEFVVSFRRSTRLEFSIHMG